MATFCHSAVHLPSSPGTAAFEPWRQRFETCFYPMLNALYIISSRQALVLGIVGMSDQDPYAPAVLPNELWVLILPYLQISTPTPGSRPPRSDLLQADLCRCMRVNKVFQEICEPLLYKNLVTHRLAAVLGGPDSTSKRRRLGLVETMHIEYARKSYYSKDKTRHPESDGEADAGEGQTAVDPAEEGSVEEKKNMAMRECVYELQGLADAFREILDGGEEKRNFFPKLRSIAVASIYGKQGRIWERYEDTAPPDTITIDSVNRYFHRFLRNIPSFQHLCLRDTDGPLGRQPPMDCAPRNTGEYLRTIHFNPYDTSEVQLPFGWPVRWISRRTKNQDWEEISDEIIEVINDIIDCRDVDETVDGLELDPERLANLEIYASAPEVGEYIHDEMMEDDSDDDSEGSGPRVYRRRPLSVEEQRRLAEEAGKAAQVMFRDNSGLDDTIQWFACADAPRCEACGKEYTGWVVEQVGMELDDWEDTDLDTGEDDSDEDVWDADSDERDTEDESD